MSCVAAGARITAGVRNAGTHVECGSLLPLSLRRAYPGGFARRTDVLQPEAAVLSIAGHVSPKTIEHYSHIRMEAKRKALEGSSPVAAIEPAGDPSTQTIN